MLIQVIFKFLLPFIVVGVLVFLFLSFAFVVRMHRKKESFGEAWAAFRKEFAETKKGFGGRRESVARNGRFTKKRSLMSPAEAHFFAVLREAVPNLPIFAKVRVADVVEAKERYSGDFLSVSQKHFDWVICHPETFEPLVAIELDDSSHRRNGRLKGDLTKDGAAQDAGLVLLRFVWQREYDVGEIRAAIVGRIGAKPST